MKKKKNYLKNMITIIEIPITIIGIIIEKHGFIHLKWMMMVIFLPIDKKKMR